MPWPLTKKLWAGGASRRVGSSQQSREALLRRRHSLKPWNQLRILDLGGLEGIYSLEFACHGAEVVSIEGRESNNAHSRFAAQVLEYRMP